MPYPSLSNAVNAAQGNRGSAHRRSFGSEISTRRVLADIEWWKVADGQRVLDIDQESEDRNREQNQDSPTGESLLTDELLGGTGLLAADDGVERPSTPPLEDSEFSHIPPASEFAALSIAPYTPPRRHIRQPSSSSLESTPEAAALSFDGLRLSFSDVDLGFPEATNPARKRGCAGATWPFFTVRTHSFADFMSFQDDEVDRFADFSISPLSSPAPLLFN